MRLTEIVKRLKDLKMKGYIPSLRKGTTGIGFTFEKEMGLSETNIPIPDLGGRVEIKTARRDSESLITLFCFNRGVWHISQKDFIEKFGYTDAANRKALKNTIFFGKAPWQTLHLDINNNAHKIHLISKEEILATWDIYIMISKLVSKLNRVLFVVADRRLTNSNEEFWFNEAYILSNPSPQKFINAFKSGKVGIDLRMHLKPNGSVRNRGTAFRIKEPDLKDLYEEVKNLEI